MDYVLMAETAPIKVVWTVVSVVVATLAAYRFGVGADFVVGTLAAVYPSRANAAAIVSLVQATIALFVALKLRSTRGWLALPFVLVTLAALFGSLVGTHPHRWGVAAVMGLLSVIVWRLDGVPIKFSLRRLPLRIDWDPAAHSTEDNGRWCWLRAIEWGCWPLFLSQPLAPLLMIWFSWAAVVVAFFLANGLWAALIRYRTVSCTWAGRGAYLGRARWITWPCATGYLFYRDIVPEAWVALAWPVIIGSLCAVMPTDVGRIQSLFLDATGHFKTSSKA